MIGDGGNGAQRAVAASTVTPAEGAAGHPSDQATPTQCANCAAALVGAYCHACGQKGEVHRTLRAFAHDALHGILHLDGKVFRTLPDLILNPGRLTRRYIDGQRARYLSPLGIFLFSVFLMFAVVQFDVRATDQGLGGQINAETAAELREAQAELNAAQADLARAGAAATPAQRDRVAEAQDGLAFLRVMVGKAGPQDQARVTAVERRSLSESGLEGRIGPLIAKLRANPDLFFFKLQTKAYKWSWLLIPISLPFLWVLFPFNRRFHLYDHAVFVTYSLSFMTMLVVLGALLSRVGLGAAAPWLTLLVPVHLYRQLRDSYALSTGAAVGRTMLLLAGSVAALIMFIAALLMLGVLS